jgi:hypothetical protein
MKNSSFSLLIFISKDFEFKSKLKMKKDEYSSEFSKINQLYFQKENELKEINIIRMKNLEVELEKKENLLIELTNQHQQ